MWSSSWNRCTPWLHLAVSWLLMFANLGESTVICDECRPFSLQEGPGVGLSLSPGHGTATVEFANGTIWDVGTIQGTQVYVQAIQSWPDARLDRIMPPEPTFLESVLLRLRYPIVLRPRTSESLMPLVDMIRALWQNVNASIHLEHKKVRVSVPDIVIAKQSSQDQLVEILSLAGLESLGQWPLSKSSVLGLYDIEDCYDEAPASECETRHGRPIRTILSIHLDKRSVSLRSMIREDGVFYRDAGATKLIWKEADTNLDDEIRQFVTTSGDLGLDFDLVSLSGPEAPHIHQLVQEIFQNNTKIVPGDYTRSAEDHTYAAARGAARLARVGMCNGWRACLQNSRCPVSEYCKWAFFGQESNTKEEL